MPPYIEQTAYATVAKYQSRTCTAIFNKPTKPGALLVVIDSAAGTLPSVLTTPAGFTQIANPGLRDIQLGVWYRQNAPATTSISITARDDNKSQMIRVLEIGGMAQANVLDRVSIQSAENRDPYTGSSGNTSQGDEFVMAVIVNQYASTSQDGFSGNLSRLFESTSPQSWSGGSQQDWERSRMSIHAAFPTSIGNFQLSCDLSTTRRWLAVLVTFKGGTSGPARFTSLQDPSLLVTDAEGDLTVFGPLIAGKQPDAEPAITTGTVHARMGPFNYQYRLGGWGGHLIGAGTRWTVEGTENLHGWEVRSSDEDQPRDHGSVRGVDSANSRQIIFKMNVGRGREQVERNMAELFRYLIPQRTTDWDLMFRFPTEPLKIVRVRPVSALRRRDNSQIYWANQQFALVAADPRHYAAVPTRVEIPVTPANALEPLRTRVVNIGNSEAYPKITIVGPSSGPPVTRLQLVNETAVVNYEAELTLLANTELVGDMDALIRGEPVLPITLDGQNKYGAWQLPREPFRIDPDPAGFGGYNDIYLETEPAGAPVKCYLDYRDTWMG